MAKSIIFQNKLEEDKADLDSPRNVPKSMGMIHSESATSTVRAGFIVDDKAVVRAIP
ncbi:putative peroxiredoxin [Thermoplasmatales archaeon]|nr:putative peroxiredoxin [Thermoplasmatales archaeon]